jgi:protein Mpv17
MFFGYMGAAEGLPPKAIESRIKNNLWASVKGSWTVWPVAHAINFRFVPTSQRLLYINSIQVRTHTTARPRLRC